MTKALRDMDVATQELRERRSRHAVTIGATPSLANRWLLPQLPEFERTHPRIEISVLVDQRVTDPREAGCNLTIRMGHGPWSGVEATPLMDDTLFPVMSPALWEKAGRPRDPGQLARLRLLHDRDPSASWIAWRARFGPPGLDVREGPRFASSDLLLHAAAQGLGVALARGRLAEGDLQSGALIRPFGQLLVRLADAYWLVLPLGQMHAATAAAVAWLGRIARK